MTVYLCLRLIWNVIQVIEVMCIQHSNVEGPTENWKIYFL